MPSKEGKLREFDSTDGGALWIAVDSCMASVIISDESDMLNILATIGVDISVLKVDFNSLFNKKEL